MTTCLGKSCSFGLPRVPFVNCCQFMYLVISLLVLGAGCGIWLYRFLIIAYLFTLCLWPSEDSDQTAHADLSIWGAVMWFCYSSVITFITSISVLLPTVLYCRGPASHLVFHHRQTSSRRYQRTSGVIWNIKLSRRMTKHASWRAPSEDSDQPVHPSSLIRVFALCSMLH